MKRDEINEIVKQIIPLYVDDLDKNPIGKPFEEVYDCAMIGCHHTPVYPGQAQKRDGWMNPFGMDEFLRNGWLDEKDRGQRSEVRSQRSEGQEQETGIHRLPVCVRARTGRRRLPQYHLPATFRLFTGSYPRGIAERFHPSTIGSTYGAPHGGIFDRRGG